MELGALICKPINPLCNQCPISNKCKSLHKRDFDITKIAKKNIDKYFLLKVYKKNQKYLANFKTCGDCNTKLVNASLIDIPIPEMTWKLLPKFEGRLYADMIIEIFNKKDIPYYVKTNWTSSAYGVQGIGISSDLVRIYVPELSHKEASEITLSIIGSK